MAYTGRCYCGKLSYEFDDPIHSQILCHCRECRYLSGGAANTSVIISEKTFFSKLATTNYDAKGTFEELGVKIDLDGFSLRDRKKKYSPRSKEIKEILEIYSNFDFKE